MIPTDELALDIALLANSPSGIVSGVTLARGDSVIEGAERVESPSNMSRKRFDVRSLVFCNAAPGVAKYYPFGNSSTNA